MLIALNWISFSTNRRQRSATNAVGEEEEDIQSSKAKQSYLPFSKLEYTILTK